MFLPVLRIAILVASCSTPPQMDAPAPFVAPGLHNVVAFGPGFWSGGVPEGDEGFETLRRWGIRTVISVDGAEPDLARAQAHGLRYVHLPIGYNGFDDARKLELVRAVRDLQRPIYIHCHHGKHRSAGAAGTIAASLGWMDSDAAVGRMKLAGTAPQYKGLYACTASASLLSSALIDAAPADFPARSAPSGLVHSMVEIDEVTDHLKAIDRAGWKAPADHPDLVPAAEAGRLADLLRLLDEDPKVRARPGDFRAMLARDAALAQELEDGIVAGQPASTLRALFGKVTSGCTACHAKHRD